MAFRKRKRLILRGERVWTFYAQRFLSDENRSLPIRNLCLRLPMAHPCASVSRPEETRASPHVSEAGARRHFLCSQEWLSLAHAAQRFSDLEKRLPSLSMLVAFGVAGEHQCAPAPTAAAIRGQTRPAQRRDHRQPERALQCARRAGWLRCGQEDQGAQTLCLCRYTGLDSGRDHPKGWSLDVVIAACLGLKDEVKAWRPFHFDTTLTFPCGLGQELMHYLPDKASCPDAPIRRASGMAAVAVLEMLMQDYPDLLIILPCWEPDVAVNYTLYSHYAGKVTVDYDPARGANVQTERPIRVEYGAGIRAAKGVRTHCPDKLLALTNCDLDC